MEFLFTLFVILYILGGINIIIQKSKRVDAKRIVTNMTVIFFPFTIWMSLYKKIKEEVND